MDRRTFLAGAGAASLVAHQPVARTWSAPAAAEVPAGYTRLRIVQGEIAVDGKTGSAYRIEQDNGAPGYTATKGERFRVALDNTTGKPTSIHWHGLILPNGQDGVPYVTQPPIPPGERRLYDFPLVQAGTYWMHSHFGFEEQWLMTAPLILRDPGGVHDEQEVLMILNDFTSRDPAAILGGLQGGSAAAMRGMAMPAAGREEARAEGAARRASPTRGADLNDVQYDALLANRRSLSDPEVVRVLPGRTVRLRIIAASSASNFFIRTGRLRAQAIAVDGEDIVPFWGSTFELAIAQRLDLRVTVPRGKGAYPILAQGEGTAMRAGLVLATPGADITRVSATAPTSAGALANAQEGRLRAVQSLPARPVDRRLGVRLGGDMSKYVWTLNGQAWPAITPLQVKQGERVEIAFVNETRMAHPMHLHGHVFQVTGIDGRRLQGARRDTVLVGPRQTVTVQFDARYPGYWMIHCHVLYHLAAGMMTVLHYEGFTNRAYDPTASVAEFRR